MKDDWWKYLDKDGKWKPLELSKAKGLKKPKLVLVVNNGKTLRLSYE